MKKNIMKFRILPCVAATILALGMTSCGASITHSFDGMKGEAMNDMDMSPAETAPSYEYSYGFNSSLDYETEDRGTMDSGSAPSASETAIPDSARKLIKNVSMDLETKEFDAFMDQLYARVSAAGGYIQSSSLDGGRYSSKNYYLRYATVKARIPADMLESFCDGVAGISNVVSRREDTSDVTLQYYDTESHMKALQTEYETLVDILEKCTKLEDVINVQQRITTVLYQIESYKTTLNNYDNLVAYSTVTLTVQEVKEETIVTEQTVGERISTGFQSSLKDIREGAEDFLVGFVANLPYLLIWAVIIAAVVVGIRSCIRRAKKKRAAKAASAPKPPVDTNEVK